VGVGNQPCAIHQRMRSGDRLEEARANRGITRISLETTEVSYTLLPAFFVGRVWDRK
jgi:hypothetical protein